MLLTLCGKRKRRPPGFSQKAASTLPTLPQTNPIYNSIEKAHKLPLFFQNNPFPPLDFPFRKVYNTYEQSLI